LPWDDSGEYVRSGHKAPGNYDTCRTIDIDREQGIKATYCRLKDKDSWEIQSYLFSKEKGWTVEKAKEWFGRHQASALRLRFFASLQDTYEEDGRHYATFYLMDTSVNCNNWRVTDEALAQALPNLKEKPLSAIPGYRVDHVSQPLDVGNFVKADKPDSYAIGTAEITDPIAWEKIKAREWGPVSVELLANQIFCSVCGRDIKAEPCEHVQSREGHEVIPDFQFERVAFVSEPAYPMAGLLYAAGKGSLSPRGDEPKGAHNPEFKGGKERLSEDQRIAKLETELQAVTAEKDKINTELGQVKQANKDLKDEVDKVKAERHLEKVKEVVDLRMQAGLATDSNAETERIKALDDPTLMIMKADVKAFIVEKERMAKVTGPKTKYSAETGDELTRQTEDTRERFFGHKKSLLDGGAS